MINKSLEKGDSHPVLTVLQSQFGLRVIPECAEMYFRNLSEAKNLKISEGKKLPEYDRSTCLHVATEATGKLSQKAHLNPLVLNLLSHATFPQGLFM